MPLDAPLPIDAHREAVVQTRVVRYEDLVLEEHPAGEASDPDGVSAALAAAAARDPGRAFDLEPEAARLILRLRTAAGWDPELPTYAELDTPAGREKAAAIPAGRVADADEIAAMAVFLASDAASYITGQTLNANGGMLFG